MRCGCVSTPSQASLFHIFSKHSRASPLSKLTLPPRNRIKDGREEKERPLPSMASACGDKADTRETSQIPVAMLRAPPCIPLKRGLKNEGPIFWIRTEIPDKGEIKNCWVADSNLVDGLTDGTDAQVPRDSEDNNTGASDSEFRVRSDSIWESVAQIGRAHV